MHENEPGALSSDQNLSGVLPPKAKEVTRSWRRRSLTRSSKEKIIVPGPIIIDVDIILARYAEVGLKSREVRRFFETILIDNMMSSLAKENIEALITIEQGRIYVTTDKIDEAASVLTRVFGVASVSPALISESSMEAMAEKTASYSRTVLKEGQGFAIKARREGNHPYTVWTLVGRWVRRFSWPMRTAM